MLRKTRPLLVALGLAILIGSLIGARELTHSGSSDASAKSGDAGPRSNGGPVVLGLVDTDPPPVAYGLPPVLQSGTVTHVYVKDGDEITAAMIKSGKDALYEFDNSMQKADVKRAEAQVAYAHTKVNEAKELADQHAASIKNAKLAVELAEQNAELRASFYNLIDKKLETYYRTNKIAESEWKQRKKEDQELYKAQVEYTVAMNQKSVEEGKLEQLKAVNPQVKVKEAEASVEQAKAELAKAQSAVELCVVRAKMPGTIEQVSIGPGTTLGVGTRTPALWLIPAGPRVVRAEIEAEFAHRVGKDITGKTVTVSDHSDPKLTYTGVVRRVGSTFLLKRSNAENFLGGDTRVIEAVIEISDPTPANRPPLRVGQRVRVNLGQ
jgi:multidrug resistance efflux pump